MMHLLRKYAAAPLRVAMMRCLPQNVAKPRIIRRSRHHWALPNIICRRQTSFKKRTFVGRQKCVFCWLREWDLNLKSYRAVRIVVAYRLGILGSADFLLGGVNRRKNDY